MELRPLGFGEIFDRAITLYIRNFLPFAAIVSVIVVPLAVLQYVADQSSVPQWDQLIQVLKEPAKAPATPVLPAMFVSPGVAGVVVLMLLVVWMLWPFALNACAIGIARIYRGKPVEFGACYRASFRRWPSVIGLLFSEGVLFIVWYMAVVLLVVISVLLVALFMRAWMPAGVVAAIAAVLVFFLALLTVVPLFVALTFAMNAVVIEERPVFSAIAEAFGRVFNRHEIWRALLFSLAAGAIMFGASMLVSGLVFVAMIYHLVVLEVIVSSLFRAAIAPFSIVLLAVYYFDVRIRREGFDLEAGLDRLASGAQVA